MSLADIKLNSAAKRGFTIVELLIVVVVIAILAAITIVSYNGITTKANASASKSVAATWQKKIELYQADTGRYPVNIGEMSAPANSGKSWYITNASLTPAGAVVDSASGKTRSEVRSCGDTTPTTANVTGVQIRYWNYEGATPAPVAITVGSCATVGNQAHGTADWAGPAIN